MRRHRRTFKIVKNPGYNSYHIKEYKDGKLFKLRSPFDSIEEARERELDILKIDYNIKDGWRFEIK